MDNETVRVTFGFGIQFSIQFCIILVICLDDDLESDEQWMNLKM